MSTRFNYTGGTTPAFITDGVDVTFTAIEEVFATGTLAARPAASTVHRGRYLDEFGTEWRSDGTNWLLAGGKLPFCQLHKASQTVATSNTNTVVSWTTEDFDAWGMHAANSTDIILPYDGQWLFTIKGSGTATWHMQLDIPGLLGGAAGSTLVQSDSFGTGDGTMTLMAHATAGTLQGLIAVGTNGQAVGNLLLTAQLLSF